MTTLATRTRWTPFESLFPWWHPEQSDVPGLEPTLRVEDYIEDGTYVLRAEMPGIDPDKDVDITVEGDLLTIRGERREETKDKNHREFHYGAFSRTVTLPRGARAEEIEATYENGVVTVTVPMDSTAPAKQHVTVRHVGNGAR